MTPQFPRFEMGVQIGCYDRFVINDSGVNRCPCCRESSCSFYRQKTNWEEEPIPKKAA